MGLLTKIQSRLELRRLEKKYTSRKKATSTSHQAAQYIDGEYIYQDPTPSQPPSSFFHPLQNRSHNPTSSSSIYAEQQQQQRQQYPPVSPTAISFSPSPPPQNSSIWPNNTGTSSTTTSPASAASNTTNTTKRTSWYSSTFTPTPASPPPAAGKELSRMLSRNSRGQSWQPPKVGWGSDGTDALKYDGEKREFRFDVKADRRSMVIAGGEREWGA